MNKVRRVQIFGERCSGTNYLAQLLAVNMPELDIVWDYGWKHGFYPAGVDMAGDCLFLVINRNPFDWLRSLHKIPWHAAPELRELAFSDFIRAQWWCVWDDDHARLDSDSYHLGKEMMFERDPQSGERFANLLKLRTAKIRNWESLRDVTQHHAFLTYESLRADPAEAMALIAASIGQELARPFANVASYKGSKLQYQSTAYSPMSAQDADFIVSQLDAALEAQLGYDLQTLAREACTLQP